jgi:hypothetical protein
MNEIKFTFEGVRYGVDRWAYDQNMMKLPDGRLLLVEGWLESYPPQPAKLKATDLEVFGPCPVARRED